MCLILFAHQVHPRYRLVLAANRDEFHARPTAPAHWWSDPNGILAGRDLERGGTWLGVTVRGRWAAVSNYRHAADFSPRPRSRGALVADFLAGELSPSAYYRALADHLDDFGGFNLIAGDGEEVAWISNRTPAGRADSLALLEPGVYGVSNHLLDTPWPKVVRGKREIATLVDSASAVEPETLLSILIDRTLASDHELPDTGVGIDLERALSASFINTPTYGTRSSTGVLIGRTGAIFFVERRFDAEGQVVGEERFQLAPAPPSVGAD